MEKRFVIDQIESCCGPAVQPSGMAVATVERSLRVFKALGDETRFAILRLIAAQEEEICACDIVDQFDVSQPTIAHHLKVLRTAGLITAERRGVWAYYAIDPEGVELLQSVTQGLAGATLVPGTR